MNLTISWKNKKTPSSKTIVYSKSTKSDKSRRRSLVMILSRNYALISTKLRRLMMIL